MKRKSLSVDCFIKFSEKILLTRHGLYTHTQNSGPLGNEATPIVKSHRTRIGRVIPSRDVRLTTKISGSLQQYHFIYPSSHPYKARFTFILQIKKKSKNKNSLMKFQSFAQVTRVVMESWISNSGLSDSKAPSLFHHDTVQGGNGRRCWASLVTD